MNRIQATLPALGRVTIDFRDESDDVRQMMGEDEFRRLRNVSHLGLVSSIFTGAHHSREEYMLLQCAVIDLLHKLHKGNTNFALSSGISLDGIAEKVSSGAELLKCWALLGNYGHTNYTYAVERSLMQAAQQNATFLTWLTRCKQYTDIRRWAKKVIAESRDLEMHYVVALARLHFFERPHVYTHYLRNLLLPAEHLFPNSLGSQKRILRLRYLFERIRNLCMSTLDSYYSHQPVDIQLASAILGLAELTPPEGEQRPFDNLLREVNGWLAEELYLHPKSCAALSWYVDTATPKVLSHFNASVNEADKKGLLKQWMNDGILKPKTDARNPVVRLKFRAEKFPTNLDLLELANDLTFSSPGAIFAVANKNPSTGLVYFDLLQDSKKLTQEKMTLAYIEAFNGLIGRVLRLGGEYFAGAFSPYDLSEYLDDVEIADIEKTYYEDEFKIELRNFARLFIAFVNQILPEDIEMRISDFASSANLPVPVLSRVFYGNGHRYDQIDQRLAPDSASAEPKPRMQEYEAIRKVVDRSKAKMVFACAEKVTLHKVGSIDGKELDQWDGLVLEILDDTIRLSIVEAKRVGSGAKNENQAMNQLNDTRKLLAVKKEVTYRRQRIKKLGAYLRYTFPI